MATVADLTTSALRELGIVDLTATPSSELSALALGLLNRILDDWNADRHAVYADVHTTPAALSTTNPNTLGPSGATFTVATSRPPTLEGVRLTDDNGETYQPPLTARGAAWWHARATPGTTIEWPTDFYYDPTFPNGSIYFYPEPSSTAIKAQLWYRVVLAQVTLATDVSVPPGYYSAMVETLKERLVRLPMFASSNSPDLIESARMARARAFSANASVPALETDYGGSSGRGVYDYTTGPLSLMR